MQREASSGSLHRVHSSGAFGVPPGSAQPLTRTLPAPVDAMRTPQSMQAYGVAGSADANLSRSASAQGLGTPAAPPGTFTLHIDQSLSKEEARALRLSEESFRLENGLFELSAKHELALQKYTWQRLKLEEHRKAAECAAADAKQLGGGGHAALPM